MFYGKKKIEYEKKTVFGFLGIFHEIECHLNVKDVAINVLIMYVSFYPFIRLTSTDCKGNKYCRVTAVTLPEVLRVVKVGGNKVQVLSDNIEVAERRAASGESRKEFLQFSEVELCCTTAMERLGICYKYYDTLKLERLIAGN